MIGNGDRLGKKKHEMTREEMEVARIRLPREGEVLGVVEALLGADRFRAKCDDGNNRIVRIPGKMRKRIWIRTGDLVLVKPWQVQSDERGDAVFRYTPTQANWLRRKGYVKSISFE